MNEPSAPYPPPYQAGPSLTGPPPSGPPPKYEEKAQPTYAAYGTGQPPYPPQGYQGGPSTAVYSQPQPLLVVNTTFGPSPALINCPYCHCNVTTSLAYEAGALTWLASGIICLFGCWLGCCLIPFCVPDLQDVEHRCPECYRVVGRYRRLS